MDADWLLYNLDPFKPRRGEGISDVDAFTSNRPKVFADKLVGAIAGAKQIIHVQVDAENQEERDRNNDYERFGIGVLDLCDDYLVSSGRVPLRTELGSNVIILGGYAAARALLRKDDDKSTIVDVTPIDPRHLLIEFGPREPIWAAIVTLRSRDAIREEYPKFEFADKEPEDGDQMERVIDYYWKDKGRYMNAVIVAEKWAMQPKDTRAKKFPIIARAVGGHSIRPGINTLAEHANGTSHIPGIETFAESAFAPIRNLIDTKNRLMSYHMALTGKGVRQIMKVYSRGGDKELDPDYEDSAAINLDVDNDEEIKPLEIAELTRDADKALAEINIEEEDGSLPGQSYGRLPGELSGNALRILGASASERLEPFIRPVESCIEGIIEALASQYETGYYKALKMSGRGLRGSLNPPTSRAATGSWWNLPRYSRRMSSRSGSLPRSPRLRMRKASPWRLT